MMLKEHHTNVHLTRSTHPKKVLWKVRRTRRAERLICTFLLRAMRTRVISCDPPCSGATPWRLLHHWRPQSWPQTWGWRCRSCCPTSSARFGCHRSIGQLSQPDQRRDGTYCSSQPSWTWWTGKNEEVNVKTSSGWNNLCMKLWSKTLNSL